MPPMHPEQEPVSEPTSLPNDPRTDNANSKPQKCPPDVLAWADRQFSDEEVMAGVREIQETGGLELKDFFHEVDQVLSPDD
jgi:hypothetical protein